MTARLRVVLVEDDHVLRTVLTAYLSGEDRLELVRTFGDAGEVVEAVTADPPDVVVLDNQLPDADGVDLLARLRAGAPLSTIVMWSSDLELAAVALARGADAFVDKTRPLQDVVDAALATRRPRALVRPPP